ncbi:MAG: response regulator [Dissulfurispiraceae bacterium]
MENIKILIVDDQSPMRTFVKASIKASFPTGIVIDEASAGDVAKDKLAINPCDIVICDWNMPGMKGTELFAWIKEQENLKDTQFLMLTASNEKEIIMNAVEMGVNDFIMKPISVDTLSKRVQLALDRVLSARRAKAHQRQNEEGDSQ